MDKQVQKQTEKALEIQSKRSLLAVMQTGDKMAINIALREFKTPAGIIKYDKIFKVPSNERIPAMAAKDFPKTALLINGALTLAFEGMNLKRGMNAIQIVDLAEMICDTSTEDNLAFEDFMLFLQKLVRGEYGEMYESMDIPKFMQAFEIYREERHQAIKSIRDETHTQHKVMGDTGKTNTRNELEEHFASMGDKLSQMKSRVDDLKQQNYSLKMDKL